MSRTRVARSGELGRLALRPGEQLDQRRARCGEPLGHLVAHGRVVVGRLQLEPSQPTPHPSSRDDEDRQQHQGEQGDLPGQRDHHDQGEDERDDVADHAGQRLGERPLRADHVVVQPTDQGSGPGSGEEGDRHRQHVVEDRPPKVEDQPFPDAGGEPPLHQPQTRLEDRDAADGQGDLQHLCVRSGGEDQVHDAPGQQRGGDGQKGPDHAEHQEADELGRVRLREAGDALDGRPGEGTLDPAGRSSCGTASSRPRTPYSCGQPKDQH